MSSQAGHVLPSLTKGMRVRCLKVVPSVRGPSILLLNSTDFRTSWVQIHATTGINSLHCGSWVLLGFSHNPHNILSTTINQGSRCWRLWLGGSFGLASSNEQSVAGPGRSFATVLGLSSVGKWTKAQPDYPTAGSPESKAPVGLGWREVCKSLGCL